MLFMDTIWGPHEVFDAEDRIEAVFPQKRLALLDEFFLLRSQTALEQDVVSVRVDHTSGGIAN